MTLCFIDSSAEVLREACRILKPSGKIMLGVVLRESSWGTLYQSKEMEGHRFYKYGTFHSCQDIEGLLLDSGFTIESSFPHSFRSREK